MNPQHIGKFLCVLITSIVILLLCFSCAALALPYGAKVTVKQLSPNIWSYTIYNTSTSQDCRLYDVAFEWAPVNATVPNGWEANWSGKDGGSWMNSSPNGEPVPGSYLNSIDMGIAPGQMQEGFEFDYEYPLDDTQVICMWWADFYWSGGGGVCTGYVELDNHIVPEPSSVVSLGIAMLSFGSIAGVVRKRRMVA